MRLFPVVLAVAVVAVAPGCKKGPKRVIPDYPTLQMRGSSFEVDGATVFSNKAQTADYRNEVQKFYDAKLLGLPGWKKTDNAMDKWTRYENGNMKQESGDSWLPIDSSQPGGVVDVIGGENQTVIMVFESVPRAAK